MEGRLFAALAVATAANLFALPARGGAIGRLRWRGVSVEGRAPARLDADTLAHVSLALRELGVTLVPAPPFDAEGRARCIFPSQGPRVARCEVVVLAGELRGERRSEIPYRDAEDLAESLALLVAATLQNDLGDAVPSAPPPEAEPPAPGERSDVARPRSDGARPRGDEERPRSDARVEPSPPVRTPPPAAPIEPAPSAPAPSHSSAVTARAPARPGLLVLGVAPSLAWGFQGEPLLFGAALRALYEGGRALRLGGTLNLEGTAVTRGGYELSFFRLLAGPRAGAGIARGRIDFDVTAGPALLLLYGAAREGSNTLATLAFVLGAHLSVRLAGPLALDLGLDGVAALTDEKVSAGGAQIAGFGRGSLDLSLGLVYRR